AREVAARFDIRRVGGTTQRECHLLGRRQQRVPHDLEPDRVDHSGITGSTMWDSSRCTVFSATRVCVWRPSGSPVLGLTSKRGKLELEMSTRIRWPGTNRFDVGPRSISIS